MYLASDRSLARDVAVKVMATAEELGLAHGEFQTRFAQEAEVLATLHHPHVVTVYDHGTTDDGLGFLVMEYVDGPRFADLLKEGPLTSQRVCTLLFQVCRALRYAHGLGVVHRDLKPTNLLIRQLGEDTVVKVVDFGLIKLLDAGYADPITETGTVVGSPHYMSPEQIIGDPVEARTDIYAVGVLLFRSLTGVYPFHGEAPTMTMSAQVSQPVPRFADVAPELELDEHLEAVVRRCLEKRPADRFQDMTELMEAMLPFTELAVELSSHTPIPIDLITSRSGRRHPTRGRQVPLWSLGLGVAVGVLMGVIVGWLLGS